MRPKHNNARKEDARVASESLENGYGKGGDLNNENYKGRPGVRKASVNTIANANTSPSDHERRSLSKAPRDDGGSKAGVSKLRRPSVNGASNPNLPQVSSRSKQSRGDNSKSRGEGDNNGAVLSNKPVRSRGLSQSPSVHSLHNNEAPNQIAKPRMKSKEPSRDHLAIDEYDEFSDEVGRITNIENDSRSSKKKQMTLLEQQQAIANKIQEKRGASKPPSQSVMQTVDANIEPLEQYHGKHGGGSRLGAGTRGL